MSDSISGTVQQFPYRTAVVNDIYQVRFRKDELDYEQELAIAANAQVENHTVYAITSRGNTFYVQFHDGLVFYGRSFRERPREHGTD